MSQYTHRVTIACPESMIPSANQLALIVGESAGDDKTFGAARYQDSLGNLYSVASTVVVANFLAIPSLGLPENPSYAEDADRVAAQEALDSIGQPGGMLMDIDSDPQQAIEGWGLTPLPSADE